MRVTHLTEKTLLTEIRSLITEAINLPADGQVYRSGDLAMCHKPLTRIQGECVLVEKYGVLWRSRLVKGRWQATEQVCGRIT